MSELNASVETEFEAIVRYGTRTALLPTAVCDFLVGRSLYD